MFKKILGAIATAAIALGANSALAVTINGTIDMGGAVTPTGGTNLSNATGLNFGGGSPTGTMFVFSATGDLASFAGNAGSIQDFTFAPFSSINSFYSITVGSSTLSFDLQNITVASQSTTFLNLTGTGVMHLNGKDDTDGSWTLTVNSPTGASFSWASTTANVIEPATMGLFGLGLAAVGFVRRRRIAA